MPTFPKDQFDDLPDDLYRVGAHRAARGKGRAWITVAWAALAVVVLTGLGLFGLSRISDSLRIELPGLPGEAQPPAATEPETPPAAEPVTDPSTVDSSISITVLNGTTTTGLANTVGDTLEEDGWPIGSRTNTADPDVETTTIYYSAPENEGIARGIALALGVEEVVLSDAFPGAAVTVVLGTDYEPAAGG
jgi:hypothetical protein